MRVRLSSKGQLVIPRDVRRQLGLESGQEMDVQIIDHKIVLEPLVLSALDRTIQELQELCAGHDYLSALEADHLEEIEREDGLRP